MVVIVFLLQVSSSGVTLTQDKIPSEVEGDIDQGMYEDETEEPETKNGPGRQYVARTYPNVIVVDGRCMRHYLCSLLTK